MINIINEVKCDIKTEAGDLNSQIIKWRRALHKIPETGVHLPLTRAYIKECLNEMGADYKELSLSSSILVHIKGALPGPVAGLRGDMDALPIIEQTGLSFASENGNMHACGHDAHSAMLLGAVKLLLAHREELHGEVLCLFQAGEETGQGARLVVREGGLDNPRPEALFAIHVTNTIPYLKSGMIGLKEGVIMAASDAFTITVRGKGGHISDLEKLCSPLSPAADLCASVSAISSEWQGRSPRTLIAIACLNAGDCFNVIPDTARLKGAIRSMDESGRNCVKIQLEQLCRNIAEKSQCKIDLCWDTANDCLINDTLVTAAAEKTAKRLFPGELCTITTEIMASEDIFHLFAKSPGSYIHLGCGFEDEREVFPLHNSHFCINEGVLWRGALLLASCAMDWTGKGSLKVKA